MTDCDCTLYTYYLAVELTVASTLYTEHMYISCRRAVHVDLYSCSIKVPVQPSSLDLGGACVYKM